MRPSEVHTGAGLRSSQFVQRVEEAVASEDDTLVTSAGVIVEDLVHGVGKGGFRRRGGERP